MNKQRLESLLSDFPSLSVVVVGDFFLDKYLIIDPALTEISLETGLKAYQIVARECSPGAAGSVTSNLRSLGVGNLFALGAIGDDGEGYELKKGLTARGVRLDYLIQRGDLFTPTYTKPMILGPDGTKREIERQDVKNRRPMPPYVEAELVARLRACVEFVDGVVIADQVQERNFGVITDAVRAALADLALRYPEKVFCADSRTRVGEFQHITLKPNRHEAARAVDPEWRGEIGPETARIHGVELSRRTGKPVFVTLSEGGMLVCSADGATHVPGVQVAGEIDPVGAGDSAMAGIVTALCSGATLEEAALVGNLVASITVQQIGTTGAASPEQVISRFAETQ